MTAASIRHANPGAMYPGPSARRYGSTATGLLENGKHQIATFPTPMAGAAALFDLLARGYMDRTLEAAITRWCGSNFATEYLRGIEERTGLWKGTWLDLAWLSDPSNAVPLAIAMARHEAGQDYPLTETQWREAHATAFKGFPKPRPAPPRPVAAADPAWTPDNPVPSPRPEARATDGMSASRKVTLSSIWTRIQVATGGGVAGTALAEKAGILPGTIQLVKSFASDNAAVLIVGGIVAGIAVSETIKQLTNEDIMDGRYTPSGDA